MRQQLALRISRESIKEVMGRKASVRELERRVYALERIAHQCDVHVRWPALAESFRRDALVIRQVLFEKRAR